MRSAHGIQQLPQLRHLNATTLSGDAGTTLVSLESIARPSIATSAHRQICVRAPPFGSAPAVPCIGGQPARRERS
eukprot:scaffold241299_cov26-Tisochrysis_lutea.AAC.2